MSLIIIRNRTKSIKKGPISIFVLLLQIGKKKGEKTHMAEALGLTGSVSCLVKNKKRNIIIIRKTLYFLKK